MTAPSAPTGVLFVCLGNICRSPLAEGIFTHLARRRGVLERFDVDSCGIGAWHAGEGADARSVQVALRHGITLDHTARQLDPRNDFDRYHLLVAMDRANQRSLIQAAETYRRDAARVHMMRSFDPAIAHDAKPPPDVPDPYSGADEGFQRVYEMLLASCTGLLDRLVAERA